MLRCTWNLLAKRTRGREMLRLRFISTLSFKVSERMTSRDSSYANFRPVSFRPVLGSHCPAPSAPSLRASPYRTGRSYDLVGRGSEQLAGEQTAVFPLLSCCPLRLDAAVLPKISPAVFCPSRSVRIS